MSIRRGIIDAQDQFLPPEYQRVEYLSRTNTYVGPYCELGYQLYTGDTISIESKNVDNPTGTEQGFAGTSSYSPIIEFYYYVSRRQPQLYTSPSGKAELVSAYASDDESPDNITARLKEDIIFQFIGVYRTNKYLFSGRIYSITIKDSDGIMKYNLVPCYRKSDNEPGFYETVHHVFYANDASTGTWELPA